MFASVYIQGDLYKKLMEYAFKKCNFISVRKLKDEIDDITNNVISVILSETNQTIDELIDKCSDDNSEEYIDNLAEKFEYNDLIFKVKGKKFYKKDPKLEQFSKKGGKYGRQGIIYYCIDRILYEKATKNWLKKYRNKIIFEKEEKDYTTYYIRLTDILKNEILSKTSLKDWNFPYSVEGLAFYKDKHCWLATDKPVGVRIYCENQDEYEYLKSMGVIFWKKKYIPTSDNEQNNFLG